MTSHCALEVEHKQAAAAHVLIQIQCYNLTPDGNGSSNVVAERKGAASLEV